jgi:2OG-Fe(II) oxygenase superfamily
MEGFVMPTSRPSLLRRDLDVTRIRSRLQRNGIVEVREALSNNWVAGMHRFLAREMPAGWWTVAIRAGGDPEYFSDTPANKPRIHEAYQRAQKELRNGNFSYCFRRTLGDHLPDCHCQECRFRMALEGNEMIEFFSRIGLTTAIPAEMFASRYSPGSFLSPHHDSGNGRVAFVLNLSPSWLPQWGGLLTFLNDDWRTIRRVCTPAFNSLCLFELPANRTVPHLVTQVVAGHRLAFTGWYATDEGQRCSSGG